MWRLDADMSTAGRRTAPIGKYDPASPLRARPHCIPRCIVPLFYLPLLLSRIFRIFLLRRLPPYFPRSSRLGLLVRLADVVIAAEEGDHPAVLYERGRGRVL
jgi:hypothetical protein